MNIDHLLKVTERSLEFIGRYHMLKTGAVPNQICIRDFDEVKWQQLFEKIKDQYEWQDQDLIREETHLNDGKVRQEHLLHLTANITVSKWGGQAYLIYDETSRKQVLEEIRDLFLSIKRDKNVSQSIGIIITQGAGLQVKTFEYSLPEHSLIGYLPPETQDFHQSVVSQLDGKDGSGLYLMYGKPGTGKTSFIKDVLSKTSKQALFISPFFTESLTSPDLISLLMNYPDSILVIEDAETVLMERKADNASAVSNLLNLTDGFLADFLNLKIICTFNTELNNIDDALLREGRMKGMHEFTEMKPERASKIAEVLERDINPEEPMTLAEICASKGHMHQFKPKKIGFNQGLNGDPFHNI